MAKVIELKILTEYFDAVASGAKKAEYRYNDRDYAVGDVLILREYQDGGYTGRKVCVRITHILTERYGIPDGWAILSIERMKGGKRKWQKRSSAQSM